MRIWGILIMVVCFIMMGNSASAEFIVNGPDCLAHGLDTFPIKASFDINKFENAKEPIVYPNGKVCHYKLINSAIYSISENKHENGIIQYKVIREKVEASDKTEMEDITINEKTKQIIEFGYDLTINSRGRTRFIREYDNDFNNLLAVLTQRYGNPTQEGYIELDGKSLKYVQFRETGKYEYYFGIYVNEINNPIFRLRIRAL